MSEPGRQSAVHLRPYFVSRNIDRRDAKSRSNFGERRDSVIGGECDPNVRQPNLVAEKFNIETMPARVEKIGDLWREFWERRLRIEDVMEKLSATVERSKRK